MLTTPVNEAAAFTSHVTLFSVLAAFVAINTLMYVGLALIKMAPRPHLGQRFRRRYARAETRSIHPAMGWIAPPGKVQKSRRGAGR